MEGYDGDVPLLLRKSLSEASWASQQALVGQSVHFVSDMYSCALGANPETMSASNLDKTSEFAAWAVIHAQCSSGRATKRHECPMVQCSTVCPSVEALEQHLVGCIALPTGEYHCPFCHKPELFLSIGKIRLPGTTPSDVDDGPDQHQKRRRIDLSPDKAERILERIRKSVTRCIAMAPTAGGSQASDCLGLAHPASTHEEYPIGRLSHGPEALAIGTESSENSFLRLGEILKPVGRNTLFASNSAGCASPRRVASDLVELSLGKDVEHVTSQGEFSCEIFGSENAPFSPFIPNSSPAHWNSRGSVSQTESDFSSSPNTIIPHPPSPIFGIESQSVTQATHEFDVPTAQGSLTVSTAGTDEQCFYIPEACDGHGQPQGARSVSKKLNEQPIVDQQADQDYSPTFFSPDPFHSTLDGDLDTGSLQSPNLYDGGFASLSPMETSGETDNDLMDVAPDTTTHPLYSPYASDQNLSSHLHLGSNNSGYHSNYPSFEEVFGTNDDANDGGRFSTDDFNDPNLCRQVSSSFAELEYNSFFHSSPTSADTPMLSPASTMTMLDSPFTPGFQNVFGSRDPNSPLFNVFPLSHNECRRRWSDVSMRFPAEFSPVPEEAQTDKAALVCLDRAPLATKATAAPAASKLNSRKGKTELTITVPSPSLVHSNTSTEPRRYYPIKSKPPTTTTAASSPSTLLDSPTSSSPSTFTSSSLSPSSSSPTSPQSPSTTQPTAAAAAAVSCSFPGCKARYRGKPRWIETSLRRHRTQEHTRDRRFYCCGFCAKTFTRSDNRRNHVRDFHFDVWTEGQWLGGVVTADVGAGAGRKGRRAMSLKA